MSSIISFEADCARLQRRAASSSAPGHRQRHRQSRCHAPPGQQPFTTRFAGGAREVSRFVINSTVGLGGLIDVAKSTFGVAESNRDTGQTLGIYGVPHGPYLVLPFLPPFSVRDFFGYVADQAMDPLGYFMPLAPAIGFNVLDQVSDRAANIDRFQGVEDSAVDLYGAVRNGYYQRRAADLKR